MTLSNGSVEKAEHQLREKYGNPRTTVKTCGPRTKLMTLSHAKTGTRRTEQRETKSKD